MAIVGRQGELDRLAGHLARCFDGSAGRAIFIEGPAGVGKTTLITALVERVLAARPDVAIARGRCVQSFESGEPYLPFIEALRDRPCTISDLVAILDVGQSTVSRHVAVLRERGIVRAVREGPTVVCHLADHRVLDALDLLRGVMRDHIRHESELIAPMGVGAR